MRRFLIAMVVLFSSWAHAFEGTFDDVSVITGAVQDVKVYLFDMAKSPEGCADEECFRVDVYVNGSHFARWPASPGKKHPGTKFEGVYTPEYGSAGRSIIPSEIHDEYFNRFGDAMPFAMFLYNGQGTKSGIALHAGHVTGRRESHGCVRLRFEDARFLNLIVREAFNNGGNAHVWTKDTYPW